MTGPDQADIQQRTTSTTPATPDASTGAGDAGATAPDQTAAKVSELEAAVAAARKESADNYERYLRAVADLENFRRRTVREKDDLRQYAAGRVLEDLLPVLDNLGLGLTAAKAPNADLKTLVGGISMVQEQMRSALSGHGLKEINPVGQPFDPNLHESLSSLPSADIPEGSVVQVVRIGYSLNGRLLRPASVVLSSGPAPEGAAAT